MNQFDIINECCQLQAVHRGFTNFLDDSYYSESVNFNLLPKFKTMCERYPELKSYKGLMQQAADLIEDSQTSVTNPKYKKFGYDALKVLVKLVKVLYSVSSVVELPYCILILPIISYLWDRLIVWGGECAEIGLVRAQLDLYIKQLNKVRKVTDDERVDQECKKLIDKLIKKREDLDKTEDELKKSNATVESVCDELKLHIYENVKDEIERNSMLELLEESTDIESFKENATEIIEYIKESDVSTALYGTTAILTISQILNDSTGKSIAKQYKRVQDDIEDLYIELAGKVFPSDKQHVQEKIAKKRKELRKLEDQFEEYKRKKKINKTLRLGSLVGALSLDAAEGYGRFKEQERRYREQVNKN